MMPEKNTILIVDDEINNLRALKLDLEETEFNIVTAFNGAEAWEILEENSSDIAVILLDRMMPIMDGMEFMKRIKESSEFCNIPVIMQTAAAEKDQVLQGIRAGVYYYMTKPYEKEIMLSIVNAAVRDYGNYRKLKNDIATFTKKLHLIRNSTFEVKTIDDTHYLSTFLAQFYPDPERVVFGLSELIINALEHGNLGITYEDKTELNNSGAWYDEIVKRQNLPENINKSVVINFVRTNEEITLKIKDEGKGFDWKRYMEISPERATHNHGRGIAMSKVISFDSIEYLGCGNEVVCKVNIPSA